MDYGHSDKMFMPAVQCLVYIHSALFYMPEHCFSSLAKASATPKYLFIASNSLPSQILLQYKGERESHSTSITQNVSRKVLTIS